MTSLEALKRDLGIIRKALNTKDNQPSKDQEIEELLREQDEMMENATKGMAPEEKARFKRELDKQVLKELFPEQELKKVFPEDCT